jgi:DnaJ-class molecular chaperone
MNLELVIRYLGYGERCSACSRTRETTRYTLRQGDDLLQQFLLCDACQDQGYVIKFSPKARGTGRYNKKQKRRRIQISRKLEKGLAEDLGGKVQPGSGNQDAKSDVRIIDEWRLEHKYTDSVKGFRVTTEMLSAVIKHANLAGEWPGLVVNFRRLGRSFVTIPYELFQEIVEKLRE